MRGSLDLEDSLILYLANEFSLRDDDEVATSQELYKPKDSVDLNDGAGALLGWGGNTFSDANLRSNP